MELVIGGGKLTTGGVKTASGGVKPAQGEGHIRGQTFIGFPKTANPLFSRLVFFTYGENQAVWCLISDSVLLEYTLKNLRAWGTHKLHTWYMR